MPSTESTRETIYSLPGLRGKTALVTGGSSGIGAATALTLGASGAEVVVSGRDRGRVEASADAVKDTGGVAHPLVCDLDEDGAASSLIDQTLASAGKIDILILAAGRFESGPIEEMGISSLDRQYRTNVRAAYELVTAALPQLRGGGAVVIVTSIVAFAGFPESAAYCASKGAVDALVSALAGELGGQGVRVNAVAPGETETPMNAS